MADERTGCFDLRLNDLRRTDRQQFLCFPRAMGAGQQGNVSVERAEPANTERRGFQFRKRHDCQRSVLRLRRL